MSDQLEPQYSAWLIDLDGTLYYSMPVKLAMAAELLLGGPLVWKTIQAFRKAHEELRRSASSATDPFARQLELASETLDQDVEQTRKIVTEWMFERPGKWLRLFRRRGLLKRIAFFRSQGGRTALVSDYPATQKLKSMRVGGLFDIVVSTGETPNLKALKPDPSSYRLAADQLRVDASKCLVIGDREDADGAAANRAGMHFERVG